MTKHECAIVMAYTGISMLEGEDFDIYHKYITDLLGRPVFIHEIPRLDKIIRDKAKEDFIKLCTTATD